MKYKFIVLGIIFIFHSKCIGQFAIGVEPILRFSDDNVGHTYNIGIVGNQYFDSLSSSFVRYGFAVSLPVYIDGRAQLYALDSTTVPFNTIVRAQQKVTDYILDIGVGIVINPKKKKDSFVLTLGVRGVFRNKGLKYLETFDRNIYNSTPESIYPKVPAALNLGFNVGVGYQIQIEQLVMFPEFSLGFGSADNSGQHPWNAFPNYGELGIAFMLASKK